MRVKRVTLFNKNHITLEHVMNCDRENISASWGEDRYQMTECTSPWIAITKESSHDGPVDRYWLRGNNRPEYRKVRIKKESPLGFYYYVTREVDIHNLDKNTHPYFTGNTRRKTYKRLTFAFDSEYYILSYPTNSCDSYISVETRPWMILDNKSMDDHFVNTLVSEATKLFELIDSKNAVKFEPDTYSTSTRILSKKEPVRGRVNDTKREIFKDLFGYPDGPKYQTNDEKILAAGFDLKTSFRKM